jgi:hypothetical protein
MRFWCVDDRVPPESIALLQEACRRRSIPFEHVHATLFDWTAELTAAPGDLLFRPAVTAAAALVERRLWCPGVATFHAGDSFLFPACDPNEVLRHAGMPVPPSALCTTRNRARLKLMVKALGGFPLVVRRYGFEGGMGVMLAESWPTFFPLVDYLVESGQQPTLVRYVPDAVHWRLVVVGDQVVASYPNPTQPDDFRSYADDDPERYDELPPAAAVRVAIDAAAALRLELGGCDVLVDADGGVHVLEVNFPCYFPQAQQVAGVDVAGAMVDHLVAKATASAP